jgi:phage tail-like protein
MSLPIMPSFSFNAALSVDSKPQESYTTSDQPYQVFNFLIEIEGVLAGGFSECSGLQVETEVYEYREGGVNEYVHRFIGSTKYPPLILKRGISDISGLWNWHQQVTEGINQRSFQRRNGTIYLIDKQKNPVMWWNFKEALPYKWTGPEFRADSGNVAFETIELAHRGLSRPILAKESGKAGLDINLSLNISASGAFF